MLDVKGGGLLTVGCSVNFWRITPFNNLPIDLGWLSKYWLFLATVYEKWSSFLSYIRSDNNNKVRISASQVERG